MKPDSNVSPLAPEAFPQLPEIAGVEAAIGRAGFYKHERPDLLLIRCAPGTRAAGVFTTNAVGSAPTDWCKQALAATRGNARGLLVNAGCANSFTGPAGDAACKRALEAAGEKLGAPAREMLAASTGVIGVVLDDAKIVSALPRMDLAPVRWPDAAAAIMTTDTFPKGAGANCMIDGVNVSIAGIAKGSGMIAPNMATMLAFVFTDAALSAPILKTLLKAETETSFNAVTVDGDRSTNDCVLLFATGQAKVPPIADASDERLADFRAALSRVLADLAIQIVRDGEGATKLVAVNVEGAVNDASAKAIARTICESPLVKTAVAGEDANWGRIVMAIGRADEPVKKEMIAVRFGDLYAARDGMVSAEYDEAAMSTYMKRQELEITVTVGPGIGRARMYTCDLTKRYVEINGDYRS
ncbi:MAG TPA: bifunctional glutamate N-acetyltransferase/amino-acid acetyltransferase ArgJ [Vitreimonas sp.]|uniref:bifunctional glutamate N-acetyltransferase/amino-acid acetyltransferase ArgJ n=1 Tax=Vitreimonas sp. TaxID=3069702 RepID=UPI002D248361|nr:bifunctional glutamate N-acetyltransferase/amino-acid acetyltransferase ArgJ [Vitreimonas sp.]HYD87643.1 bifunctional glutamate N-acetyltransferase/amino-acid acetyltransferase ArgJ [Vitreimonas sp.]